MNKIVVSILCGRGDTTESIQTIASCRHNGHKGPILPLFGIKPTRKFRGFYLLMPEASQNKKGQARTALVQKTLALYDKADVFVFLDDDTAPQPGYFDHLEKMELPGGPTLMGGKLLNADGKRSWDVCTWQNNSPVVVPYDFWSLPQFEKALYLSGPQHILNKSGLDLAAKVGYPDVSYGEDTNFCYRFKEAGGVIQFIPDITARLTHQHNQPNEAVWTGV